jgi:hypothetical protein
MRQIQTLIIDAMDTVHQSGGRFCIISMIALNAWQLVSGSRNEGGLE